MSLDVTDSSALDAAIAGKDVVISLIPYTFHATVLKSAIKNKCNMVTTSYINPQMEELDAQAKEAGITVLNEIGLDPGIDHLYAVKTIEEVHRAGGKVVSFLSYCGGLPAPESSDNPLGYKFSWSSRGVLLALGNSARLYRDGKQVDIEGTHLMAEAKPYYIYPGFNFVAYPNRDSTPYRERYSIPEARDLVRGTLRFAGFPEFIGALVQLGFLDQSNKDYLGAQSAPLSWAEATQKITGSSSATAQDLEAHVSSKATFASPEDKARILAGLRWIGLFSHEQKITPRGTPLDTLCATLEQKMQYGPGERDMVMLQHKFGIEWADGRSETRTSTLVEYGGPTGQPGSVSAMAKLVGVPCGVATLMVLDGSIADKGVVAPVNAKIALPILEELKKWDIELLEKTLD